LAVSALGGFLARPFRSFDFLARAGLVLLNRLRVESLSWFFAWCAACDYGLRAVRGTDSADGCPPASIHGDGQFRAASVAEPEILDDSLLHGSAPTFRAGRGLVQIDQEQLSAAEVSERCAARGICTLGHHNVSVLRHLAQAVAAAGMNFRP